MLWPRPKGFESKITLANEVQYYVHKSTRVEKGCSNLQKVKKGEKKTKLFVQLAYNLFAEHMCNWYVEYILYQVMLT